MQDPVSTNLSSKNQSEFSPVTISLTSGVHRKKKSWDKDKDMLGRAWPLRILQIIGFWQPSWVPKVISWLYFVVIVGIQLWATFRVVYFYISESNYATGTVYGLGTLLCISLCILLPYNLGKRKNTYLSNTIDFVVTNKEVAFKWLCVAYGFLFTCLFVPQLVYVVLVQTHFISSEVVGSANFTDSSGTTRQVDLVFIMLGKVLNLLTLNTTLLYLSFSAHLQSFQINSLLEENLSDNMDFLQPSHLKPVIHLVVQSLSDGNRSMEQLNTVVVLIFLLNLTSIATMLIFFDTWDGVTLSPIFFGFVATLFFFVATCLHIEVLGSSDEKDFNPSRVGTHKRHGTG
eukprot:TRINITY_DN1287_c0_g3_i14.p1 TRINITY_DN1287_c0_g3~~TRINITY_DN1287_c0_g3_i14.p1  ORF type:complete len:344 (+),score=45.01 TRINITY_DN1287_c0_g3_i14:108-1139(+)